MVDIPSIHMNLNIYKLVLTKMFKSNCGIYIRYHTPRRSSWKVTITDIAVYRDTFSKLDQNARYF